MRFLKNVVYLEKTLDFSQNICYNHKMIESIKNGRVRLHHFCISEGGNSYNERTGRAVGKKHGKINR